MGELIFKDLTEKIIKGFFEVYNHLGFGYSKDVYIESLAFEMHKNGLVFNKEEPVDIFYKEIKVGQYKLDFVVEDKVMLYIDTNEAVSPKAEYTIINHLRSTKYEVGLLLNFGKRPEVRRKIFQNAKKTFIKEGDILNEE